MENSNKRTSKDKLIEAAVNHLNREGLNNFTATSLTRSANLGYGTFYKYFSSTEDVLESAIKKNVADWSKLISASNKSEPDRLLAFLETVYKTFLQFSNNASMRWLLEKPNYFVEIYFDLNIAKRSCKKDQKVIKVPNTEVFKIVAPILTSRGISRIVSAEQLIAL